MTDTLQSAHLPRVIRSGPVAWTRTVLRADAAACAMAAAVMFIGALPLATLLADESTLAVRAIGVLLAVVAGDLALLSLVRENWLPSAARVAAALNIVWIVGTVIAAVAGVFTSAGVIVAVGGAVGAAALARIELVAASGTNRSLGRVSRIAS